MKYRELSLYKYFKRLFEKFRTTIFTEANTVKILTGIFTFIVLNYWKFQSKLANIAFLLIIDFAIILSLPFVIKQFKPFLKNVLHGIIIAVLLNIAFQFGSLMLSLKESNMYWSVFLISISLVVFVPFFKKNWNELGFLVYALSLIRLFYWLTKSLFNLQ
jgi:hypothetical protein